MTSPSGFAGGCRATILALGVLVAGCRSTPSAERADRPRDDRPSDATAVVSPEEQPDTTPPADVSHGEAPIGGPAAEPAPTLARLAPAERKRLHRIRMEMTHTSVNVPRACGTLPGPSRAPSPVRPSGSPGRYRRLHPHQQGEYSAQHGLPRGRDRAEQVLRERDAERLAPVCDPSDRCRPRRAHPALRGQRGPEPRQRAPCGRWHVRAGVRG
jgi:hypothetical protein